MSTITTTIHADKAGMIAHLEQKRVYALEQADNMNTTRRNRDRAMGEANGLWLAIQSLKDWAEADAIQVEETTS